MSDDPARLPAPATAAAKLRAELQSAAATRAEQLDGLGCIVCSRRDGVMAPVVRLPTGSQLFACAFECAPAVGLVLDMLGRHRPMWTPEQLAVALGLEPKTIAGALDALELGTLTIRREWVGGVFYKLSAAGARELRGRELGQLELQPETPA